MLATKRGACRALNAILTANPIWLAAAATVLIIAALVALVALVAS